MASGKVDKIPSVDGGTIPVRWRPVDVTSASVDMGAPRAMVWHTTETDGVPAYAEGFAPHFTAPDDELVLYQHVELGKMGTAMRHTGSPETNRICVVQCEQVARSSLAPWAPKERAQQVLIASLATFAEREFDVPKRRVFPDTLDKGVVWARPDNPRRAAKKWSREAGHFTHCEVTAGNTHWDCGSEQLQAIIDGGLTPGLTSAWQILAAWQAKDGHRRTRPLTPHVPHLARLLRLAGRDEDTVRRINRHEDKKHRIVLVERLVDAETAEDWEEWRDGVLGDEG
jgi:hypothetical protein